MGPKHNLLGERFGRLVVERLADVKYHGEYAWTCRCDCGRIVTVPGSNLLRGRRGRRGTTSCGCWYVASRTLINRTHGRAGTKTYVVWRSMKQRCENPKVERFPRYGGRGIRVCDRWKHFAAFVSDMGECPPGHSLDRIDNDRDYEPQNCRWVPLAHQQAHTSRSRYLTFDGKTMILAEWARRLGIPHKTIADRLKRGFSVERALTS